MTVDATPFDDWLTDSAAGAYVRAWQQRHYDEAVDEVFGYHALQIGVSGIDALRASRIQHSWRMAMDAMDAIAPSPRARASAQPTTTATAPVTNDATATTAKPRSARPQLVAAPEALPFAADQFDLIAMPHGLEACHQPHAALREATRILRPEGRLVISGFNPARLLLSARPRRPLAPLGKPIGYLRLRDWLHLLNFEVQQVSFGCHIPGFQTPRWYERLGWIDRIAEDRVPFLGSAYFLVATKKVQGVRMLEATWKPLRAKGARSAAVNRSR